MKRNPPCQAERLPCELFYREVPKIPQTIWTIDSALGCPIEPDEKTLIATHFGRKMSSWNLAKSLFLAGWLSQGWKGLSGLLGGNNHRQSHVAASPVN